MIRSKENLSPALRVGALLMLACYVVIFFQINLVHHIHHDASDHQHVHHDVETESDACHRAIYHPEENDGCDHDAHILAVSDDCEFCDSLLSQSDLEEDLLQYQEEKLIASIVPIFSNQFVNTTWSRATPLRGPPTVIN